MTKFLTIVAVIASLLTTAMSTEAFAKHGKDDPAGHVSGEGAGHP